MSILIQKLNPKINNLFLLQIQETEQNCGLRSQATGEAISWGNEEFERVFQLGERSRIRVRHSQNDCGDAARTSLKHVVIRTKTSLKRRYTNINGVIRT